MSARAGADPRRNPRRSPVLLALGGFLAFGLRGRLALARRRRLRLGLRLRALVRGLFLLRRPRRPAGALAVVADVPAASLELERGPGEDLLDLTAALRTLLERRVAHLLQLLGHLPAGITLVFVDRH